MTLRFVVTRKPARQVDVGGVCAGVPVVVHGSRSCVPADSAGDGMAAPLPHAHPGSRDDTVIPIKVPR